MFGSECSEHLSGKRNAENGHYEQTLFKFIRRMDIPAKYDPKNVEDKWYQYWLNKKFFKSVPDENRKPYTIVIPPPNVTGVLHMGHMLNNTIQDIIIRRARMRGFNACWVPGTDHASIATEARVVAKLANEGIKKSDLTRDEFLKHALEWKTKHGDIILEQLKKLGVSCDWDRTKFTMDDEMSESVIKVFVDLFNKGQIYRGVRMVNWDPQAKTALSDEEVIYQEVQSKLYFVKYKIEGEGNHFITIATTRPETILGDTAVCVNPGDERYKHLKGKKIIVPLVNRIVPLIYDAYVDPEFGTGALKFTPAHDFNDYEIGLRYNLPVIDIFNDDGTLNEKAELFIGEDRFKVREEIIVKLKEEGLLEDIKDYVNKVGYSERTHVPIEPKLSVQWFLKMKDLSKPALENVMNDNIQLYPAKFKNTYRHWMENIKDWCISRQLWWGQRIPAYYLSTGETIVAENAEKALTLARLKSGNQSLTIKDLRQDEDVLDTWFSSWLWPISVFDGIRDPNNKDIQYYYPTNDLITAPEILFFWVARMIMSGYEFMGEKPFSHVYLTGIVRDKQGRKMSKSLGNSPDPLDLIDKYSADGVRVGMLLCSPAGNDLPFDESLTEQGRNFGNKIWNAFRLVKNWQVDETIPQPSYATISVNWFDQLQNQTIESIDKHFESYRISDALMTVFKLFRDEFSSWYLEMIKPEFQKPIDAVTYQATILFFDKLLKLLHPFMPFITEEIWHCIEEREEGESIVIEKMPKAGKYDVTLINQFELVKEVISHIRTIRKENEIPLKQIIKIYTDSNNQLSAKFIDIINKLAFVNITTSLSVSLEYNSIEGTKVKATDNINTIEPGCRKIIEQTSEDISSSIFNSLAFIVGQHEYIIIFEKEIDIDKTIKELTDELNYQKGFLELVIKKLNNERFVNSAPAKVIEIENNKKADTESKIHTLEKRLENLKK